METGHSGKLISSTFHCFNIGSWLNSPGQRQTGKLLYPHLNQTFCDCQGRVTNGGNNVVSAGRIFTKYSSWEQRLEAITWRRWWLSQGTNDQAHRWIGAEDVASFSFHSYPLCCWPGYCHRGRDFYFSNGHRLNYRNNVQRRRRNSGRSFVGNEAHNRELRFTVQSAKAASLDIPQEDVA